MVGVALRVTSQDDESRARRGAWWLTVLTLASVVMSAAVAPVAAALVFAVGTQALLDASPREGRHRGGAVAPAGTFFGFALLWYVGVLRQTIPEGMHRFWQSKFLDVTPVPALVDEVSAGVQVVLGQAASLPFALVGLLVLAGLGTTIARGLRLRSAGESAAAEFVLISVMVLPWLASLALALLHRAPWGGGRTDSALVVPVVLALTAIFASRPARRSLTVLAVAAAAALATAAVVRTESSLYPDEDMRQLVASAQLHEEDAILVNGGSIYPYGFYATTRVTVQSSRGLNGFAPRFDDERVRLLASDPNRPETYLSRVTAALGDDCHAWFFASHPVRDIQPTEAALVSLGFTKDRTLQFGPARATHWTLGC